MFSSKPNYTKLKTHLRLAVNRLRLVQKKRTELAQKARKEIADYLAAGKTERAKVRVEHIIREDYLVEALEIVELYCDLLLTRFSMLSQMTELDDSISEAVSSLLWVSNRIQADITELSVVHNILQDKYGREYAVMARTATGDHKVSEKLMHKLAIQAPPKILIEKYLIEIANIYHVEYEPDPIVMRDGAHGAGPDGALIDLQGGSNNLGGGDGVPRPMGFIDFPQPPQLPPHAPSKEFEATGGLPYPVNHDIVPPPFNMNIPPYIPGQEPPFNPNVQFDPQTKQNNYPPPYSAINPDQNVQGLYPAKPQPKPRVIPPGPSTSNIDDDFSNLPSVPSDLPDIPSTSSPGNDNKDDEIDFDDLAKRFEELKKKK